MTRAVQSEPGFSLVEVLVGIMILTVALLGIGGVIALQGNSGIAAGSMTMGQAAVSRGYYISTATMLAQERLEQMKNAQYTLSGVDQITTDRFGTEPLGSILNYPNFSRTVTITPNTPGPNMKTITVTVTFNLPKETGTALENVAVSTIIAARP